MPFSEPNVKKTLQHVQLSEDISQIPAARNTVVSGLLIAEIEVMANDYYRVSLGTFSESSQPKGFCVSYSIDTSEGVAVDITTSEAADGTEYYLEISNSTNQPIVAEVRML